MRRGARTDLCGGRSAMVVPTATLRLLATDGKDFGAIIYRRGTCPMTSRIA
jgi:hypothetical protein